MKAKLTSFPVFELKGKSAYRFFFKYSPPKCSSVINDVRLNYLLVGEGGFSGQSLINEKDPLETRAVRVGMGFDNEGPLTKISNALSGAKHVEAVVETYWTKNKKTKFSRKLVSAEKSQDTDDKFFEKLPAEADNDWTVFVEHIDPNAIAFPTRPNSRQAIEMVFESNGVECFLKHLRIHDKSKDSYKIVDLNRDSCVQLETLGMSSERSQILAKDKELQENYQITEKYREYCKYFYNIYKPGEAATPAVEAKIPVADPAKSPWKPVGTKPERPANPIEGHQ